MERWVLTRSQRSKRQASPSCTQEIELLCTTTTASATAAARELKKWELHTADALLDKREVVKVGCREGEGGGGE